MVDAVGRHLDYSPMESQIVNVFPLGHESKTLLAQLVQISFVNRNFDFPFKITFYVSVVFVPEPIFPC